MPWFLVGLALAQSGPGGATGGTPGRAGIVVRLDAAGQSLTAPVTVTIASEGASPVTITLNDGGQSPDVSGSDGTWSGAGIVSGETGEVSVTAGSLSATGGTMSLGSGSARDLSLRLDGSSLTQLETQTIRPPTGEQQAMGAPPLGDAQAPQGPDGAATPPPLGDGAPVTGPDGTPVAPAAGGVPPVGPPSDGAPVQPTAIPAALTDTRSDAVLYVAFGVGGLLLAAVGYFWMRGGSGGGAPSRPPRGVTLVPEPGLFGPTSPPLAPGATQWVVAEAEQPWALGSLLATIAQYRPVLVCAPETVGVPSVVGGPVFRTSPKKPGALVDAVDGLLDAHPRLVVVIVGEPGGAGTLPKWTKDLVEDLPVLALVTAPVDGGGTVVRCRVENGRLRGEVG